MPRSLEQTPQVDTLPNPSTHAWKPDPAAWKLQDEKFLAGEAPALPLADCNQRNCDCRYLDHDDRRSGEDQRDGWGQFGGFVPHAGTDKRRTTRDRREKTS